MIEGGRKLTVRSPLVLLESAGLALMALPVGLIFALLGSQNSGVWALSGVVAPLLLPLGWTFRSVTIRAGLLQERRFGVWGRTWNVSEIKSISLLSNDVGWGVIPASSIAIETSTGSTMLRSQTRWALTESQRTAANNALTRLAAATGLPAVVEPDN